MTEPSTEHNLARLSAAKSAQPVGEIHPQPWMTAPETRMVMEALRASGAEVRFIGGCVRDAVLKRPIRDIDLALALPPDTVMLLLRSAGIKAVPTGIDHGTVTAILHGTSFEVTTLRVDVETFGRRARVAFTDDWLADAARRDFTFNALSCTSDGRIYDYFDGLEDLGHGRVRFVGDASERIAEDVLRLLRYFRFFAHYGRPPPDLEALAACRAWAHKVDTLSGERVRVEIFRTLMAPDPAEVFQLMQDWEVLPHVLPEARRVERLRALSWLDSRALHLESVAPHPVRRLAALVDTDASGAARIAERLKLSNHQRDRLAAMQDRTYPVSVDGGPLLTAQALYRVGSQAVRDSALLAWAEELAAAPRLPRGRNEQWTALLRQIDNWQTPELPVKGRDVLSLGVPAGPRVGQLLRELERWWMNGGFAADRDACLERLRALVAQQ